MKALSISIIIFIALFGFETAAIQCNVSDYEAHRLDKTFTQKCEITMVRENTFVNWSTRYLSLQENGIENIQPGAFKNLTNLATLNLSYNKLKLIETGTFTKLPIGVLRLSHNWIETIEDLALSDLPNLHKLHLDNNKIENISISKIMDDPSGLVSLYLTNNSLTKLTADMLRGLTNLRYLPVDFNKIETIEEGTFEQAPNLYTLTLSNNKIKEIDSSIFPRGGFLSLYTLHLSNNELMYLKSDFFLKLKKLNGISLDGNPWLRPCLKVIFGILYGNGEGCRGVENATRYTCIGDPTEINCSFKYNSELSARYLENKIVMNTSYELCEL